jgi:alkaline phosphatase
MTKNLILIVALIGLGINSYAYSILPPNDSSLVIKAKKARNIILLIGDGMGVAQIYSGLTANKGSLNLEQFKCIGFSKTWSASDYVTDSGAGATAISTGVKTYNGAIGVDTSQQALKTILEIAEEHQMSTGLVSTSSITHATPASFIAHNADRDRYEEIAADFLKTDIEVFIGGGKDNFSNRTDKRDLIAELNAKGYTVTDSLPDLRNLKTKKLAGFTAKVHNPPYSKGRGDMLTISSLKAIEILNENKKGFFLMIEGSQIDWACHENNTEYLVNEMIDFDRTIGKVLEFAKADENTLVIVTADHETGGAALFNGDYKTGKVEVNFSTKHHTGIMVPVFAYGPGSEKFMGIYENTSIFYKMLESLNIPVGK